MFPSLLVSACSTYGSHYLVRNIDSFFSDKLFEDFNSDKVETMMNTGNEFMVYFSSTGCSSCETISGVLREYLPQNRVLMFNLDYATQREELDVAMAKFEGKFKSEFPSVYIVKGNDVTQIPSTKLNSSSKVGNTFREYQHDCNVYFGTGDVLSKIYKEPDKINFSEFSYVSFNFENKKLLDLYKTHLSTYIENLTSPIIVSDYKEINDQIYATKLSITTDGEFDYKIEASCSDASKIDEIIAVFNS